MYEVGCSLPYQTAQLIAKFISCHIVYSSLQVPLFNDLYLPYEEEFICHEGKFTDFFENINAFDGNIPEFM